MKVSRRLAAVLAVAGFFQVHNAFAISVSEGLAQGSSVDVSALPGFSLAGTDSTYNLLVDMTGTSETAGAATFTLAGQAASSTVLNAQTASEPEGVILGINDTGAAPEPATGAMLAAGAGLLLAYLLGRSKAKQGRA